MSDPIPIFPFLAACLTLLSVLTWIIIIALSVSDSHSDKEKKTKKRLLLFFIYSAGAWIFMITYTYFPSVATWFNTVGYFSLIMVPVQSYCFICALSEDEHTENFSNWHYFIPVTIIVILSLWSQYVDWDVQMWLIKNRGALAPGNEAYSYFFLSLLYVYALLLFIPH